MKCAFIGSWSWGTALAQVVAHNGHTSCLYALTERAVEDIMQKRENTHYFPWKHLYDSISCSNYLEEVLSDAEVIFLVVPSIALRDCLESIKEFYHGQTVVLASKGWRNDAFAPLSTLIEDVLGEYTPVVVLSGASHAEEVIENMPTAVELASKHEEHLIKIQWLLENEFFHCEKADNLVSLQLAWWLKNIIAMACWVSDGLWFGVNTKAILFTNWFKEIQSIGTRFGTKIDDFLSYGGIWDLYVTSSSNLSRNWRAGNFLAQGYKKEEIIWTLMHTVCEGFYMLDNFEKFFLEHKSEFPLWNMMLKIVKEWDARWAFEEFLANRE